MKMAQAHVVPLSAYAVRVLKRQWSGEDDPGFVFKSRGAKAFTITALSWRCVVMPGTSQAQGISIRTTRSQAHGSEHTEPTWLRVGDREDSCACAEVGG